MNRPGNTHETDTPTAPRGVLSPPGNLSPIQLVALTAFAIFVGEAEEVLFIATPLDTDS